jgi:peptidoglycan/xylan/chitin deacetylase (PgdA/CDA1 family)
MATVPPVAVQKRAAAAPRRDQRPRWRALAASVLLCFVFGLAACGGSDEAMEQATGGETVPPEAATLRTPDPAPSVKLTSIDREVWIPGSPDRSRIPVLLYHGIAPPGGFANPADAVFGLNPEEFAKQMVLLDTAGYETVTLDEFVRFHAGEDVALPARPLLLTFDDGRADSYTGGDAILEELGFNAVMFVDTGAVERGDAEYLTWPELEAVQATGRWELQLHAGAEGHSFIQHGPAATDTGPFYAYRLEDEALGGWRERTFGDISGGEEVLAANIPSYEPLAFAPPFGSYGQESEGTNDPRIAEEFLPWLVDRFGIVFTQDQSIFTTAGQAQPLGRLQLTRDLTGGELHEWLRGERGQ